MYNKDKTVIVYLAMNTKKDESYGRDSRSMLEKSLDSLYLNYNNEFKHNIIIFYDNKYPFTESDIQEITKDRKEIKFQLIPNELWCPPECEEIKNNPDPKKWTDPKFSVGYRNMMRWYGILIYEYLVNMGYEWYMRMDDDSLLHSRIEYDLFKFMYDNEYEYGFRSYCNDHIFVSKGLIEFCKQYCLNNNIEPTFLNRYGLNNEISTTQKHNILGYYNNFLISKLSFWMREDVQKFIKSYDNSGYQYTRRWNDLISQAVTVQIFMKRNKIYHFNDWCYEHATFDGNYDSKNSLAWGGLYPAIKDSTILITDYVKKWTDTYKTYCKNTFDTLNVKDCLDKYNINLSSQNNLNLKSNNNRSNKYFYIGSYDNLEDIYYAIEDYWINCRTKIQRAIQFQYSSPIAFIWFNSDENNLNYKKLYVINHQKELIKFKNDSGKNNATCFIVNKDIFVTDQQKLSNYMSNLTNNDRFVHYIFGNNYKGYYIEAGACDGIKDSNTYFLENTLGWTGVLIEPTSKFNDLNKNRKYSKNINCVLGNSDIDSVDFIEFSSEAYNQLSCTEESFNKLSTEDSNGRKDIIHLYEDAIKYKKNKKLAQKKLDSLLDEINAPNIINYLSLDVEGNEEYVIEGIDFTKRQILLISAENLYHNKILISQGYIKIKNPFDKSDDEKYVTWVSKDKVRSWDYWWISPILFEQKKYLLESYIIE
jgi:alpha 1,2-mannosyltransferase